MLIKHLFLVCIQLGSGAYVFILIAKSSVARALFCEVGQNNYSAKYKCEEIAEYEFRLGSEVQCLNGPTPGQCTYSRTMLVYLNSTT